MRKDQIALIKAFDDAANAIAARLTVLIGQTTDAEFQAALQVEVTRLQKLGADPADPIPGTVVAPAQETTPILDAK